MAMPLFLYTYTNTHKHTHAQAELIKIESAVQSKRSAFNKRKNGEKEKTSLPGSTHPGKLLPSVTFFPDQTGETFTETILSLIKLDLKRKTVINRETEAALAKLITVDTTLATTQRFAHKTQTNENCPFPPTSLLFPPRSSSSSPLHH